MSAYLAGKLSLLRAVSTEPGPEVLGPCLGWPLEADTQTRPRALQ